MNQSWIVLVVTFAIAGCHSQSQSRKYWFRPNTTLEQTKADCQECASKAVGQATEGHYQRYREHMTSGDPIPFNGQLEESNRSLDEKRLFRGCMKSLGYREVSESRIDNGMKKADQFAGDDIQYLAGE